MILGCMSSIVLLTLLVVATTFPLKDRSQKGSGEPGQGFTYDGAGSSSSCYVVMFNINHVYGEPWFLIISSIVT